MSIYSRKVKVNNRVKVENKNTPFLLTLFLKHSRKIGYSVLIILVCLSGWGTYAYYKTNIYNKISDMYYYNFGDKTKPANNEGLKNIQKFLKGKKNKVANLTLIKIANIQFDDGKFDEALLTYKKVFKESENSLLKTLSMMGIGYTEESKGRYKEAIEAFEKIKTVSVSSDSKPYLLTADISIARCLEENGDKSGALEKYEFIKENYKESSYNDLIEKKIIELKK